MLIFRQRKTKDNGNEEKSLSHPSRSSSGTFPSYYNIHFWKVYICSSFNWDGVATPFIKICLLIKVVGGMHRIQGLMSAMVSVGEETELLRKCGVHSSFPPIQPHFQVHPSTLVCVCVFVCRVWCIDCVVPFLRPIVPHQAPLDVISPSQAKPSTMLHYLYCVCACVCLSPCKQCFITSVPELL